MRTFVHDGHCGDIVAALPVIRALGGGKLIITNHRLAPEAWRPMRGEWRGIPSAYECIKPLLDAQPYLTGVEWQDRPTEWTHDFREFRQYYSNNHSLTISQALCVGLNPKDIDYSPWLQVKAHHFYQKTVLFSRTQRHHDETSPVDYSRLLNVVLEAQAFFVGVEVEWQEFSRKFGSIPFLRTENLLETAQYIAGSSTFVGNPSVLMWIAMAMGIPVLQEQEKVEGLPPVYDAIIPRENVMVYSRSHMVPSRLIIKMEPYQDVKGL